MKLSSELRYTTFIALLVLWTVGLLAPDPGSSEIVELGGVDLAFIISKCFHIGVYGFIAFLGGFVIRSRASAWWILGLLVVHAIATEVLQPYMGRGGSVRDVGLDTLGIAVGVAANWKRWQVIWNAK